MTAYDTAVLADSPVLYWKLDEADVSAGATMADSSGNGADGIYGDDGNTSIAGLFAGSTAALRGIGTLPLLRQGAALPLGSAVAASEAWVSTSSTDIIILGLSDSGGSSALFIAVNFDSGGAQPGSVSAVLNTNEATQFFATAVIDVADGDPHHLVASCDGSTLELFIDGASAATVAVSGTFGPIDTTYCQLASVTPVDVDAVAVYGAALTSGQVAAHYAAASVVTSGATPVGTVMDQLGVALATISGLRVFDFPPKSAQPPFAFVDFPDTITYDATYGRALDRMPLRVFVAVGVQVDRVCRDALAEYAAGSGTKSIKAAIEAATVGQSVRVTSVDFGPVGLAGGTYAGAIFHVDVAA